MTYINSENMTEMFDSQNGDKTIRAYVPWLRAGAAICFKYCQGPSDLTHSRRHRQGRSLARKFFFWGGGGVGGCVDHHFSGNFLNM